MASVWGELKRRNVVKVAAAYAVVGWLIVEIASTVFPILQIPDWAIALITMLLILCFPVALILSWAYELTPEGMRRSNQVPATESITRITGRKLDFVIIGLLVLAVGFMFVDNYLPESGPSAVEIDPASLEPEIDDSPATGESVSEEREVLPNSVAVLPLENLSPDPDNAYFAAGMHEAILNELAKISAMNVIARTSMLQYADRTTPIADIARDLNVETIMEGSVQYANDRVLVTAQLIDPETNAHLWSESYNREFADVFAIQADIAMNIANALEAEFSPTEQANIEKRPTDSLEAYALYLRALSAPTIQAAEPLIDRAIGLDSEFALAYAWRMVGNCFRIQGVGGGASPDQALDLERSISEDAQRIISLDPTLGVAHAGLAVVHQVNWRGTAAEQAFQSAVEASPNDLDVAVLYGRFKRHRGERGEAIRLFRRAVELDPNSNYPWVQLGIAYRHFGMWDDAAAVFMNVLDRNPADFTTNIQLAWVEALRGNAAEAVRLIQVAEQLGRPTTYRLSQMVRVYGWANRPDEAERVFAEFERRATEEGIGQAWWAYAYTGVGDYEQAHRAIESAVNERVAVDQTALTNMAENAWDDPELDKPEFRELFERLWVN